jgi:hypothetical protein
MTVEAEGHIILWSGVVVTITEMSTWTPERIYAFFDGIAQMIMAAGKVKP